MVLYRTLLALSLCIVCFSAIATKSALAQAGYSRGFLREVNIQCWSGYAAPMRLAQPRHRPLVRVHLNNRSGVDMLQVCVYDLTCGEVAFSGVLERRRRTNINVCSDSTPRGHILILAPSGERKTFRGLRNPANINLDFKAFTRGRIN
jgi:hypothetical protein